MNIPLSRPFRIAVAVLWHALAVLGVVLFPPGAAEIALAAVVYAVGMFAVTAGYHRYFSHRAFQTSRAGQLALAVAAQSTLQKGVLWWAARHRHHHRVSDGLEDLHSPVQHGLITAHIGWVVSDEGQQFDGIGVADLARYPELRWLNAYAFVPPLMLALGMSVAGGLNGLVWGFAIPILVVQHATSTINSLSHVWGRRAFPTTDDSRNNGFLALITFGEGWHNNHHWMPGSARQGQRWWEFDLTFHLLTALSWVGLVWDLRVPSEDRLGRRMSPAHQKAERAQKRAAREHEQAVSAAKGALERLHLADAALALALPEA